MPRMISFSMTTPQFIAGTKDVTRRMGWLFLKAGDELMAVEKAMGLGKGGKVKRLGMIMVVDARREWLGKMIHEPVYGIEEAKREGFPQWNGKDFVDFYCAANKCDDGEIITRIEFARITSG